MIENKITGADLSLYEESFNNNLKVFYVPIPNKKEYYISYVTRFGSNITSYQKGKNNINYL